MRVFPVALCDGACWAMGRWVRLEAECLKYFTPHLLTLFSLFICEKGNLLALFECLPWGYLGG